MSTIRDVSTMIETAGLGVFASISDKVYGIYLNYEPDTPNRTVTLADIPSRAPAQLSNRNLSATEYPAFQIRVRAMTYSDGETEIKAICELLLHTKEILNGFSYVGFNQITNVIWLELDNNKRHVWVVSFEAIRTKN